ncbi:NYN domain-containing protein [Alysiella crassa]|uniref:NYN domain n=1 Tax=Alysiella crassa TaxID=153491 RepID=A0A376BSI6_9NEIS|nr:NYN domain [Alysiella crassa]
MSTSNKKLAVLIDADNAPADSIDEMLEEIAKYGIASVKRIYGDWSHGLSKWKAVLLPHAIIPVQQFAYTKGKNATDMALVIDAMDLLYSGNVDGFCIVSSDSDFTRLASRIRESGLTVYGFGEKKTPESFRRACDKFVYIEIFRPQKPQHNPPKNPQTETTQPENKTNPNLLHLLKRAVKENADDLGWAHLASIGSYINKINPDFDARLYGFGKLSDLIKSFDLFEHRTDNNQLQIRRKKSDNQKTETKIENKPENKAEAVSGSLKNKKRRGRPKKNDNETSSVNTAASELNKQETVKPETAKNETSELSGSLKAADNEKSKKRRGRPKKNSSEQASIATTELPKPENPKPETPKPETAPTETPESSGSLKTEKNKKQRGRPKKNQAETPVVVVLENAPAAEKPAEKPKSKTKSSTPNKAPFGKVILLAQAAVDAVADASGWARFGDVVKHLETQVSVSQYGFANARDLLHSVYADWLTVQKIGRGERVRVNKRFINKE